MFKRKDGLWGDTLPRPGKSPKYFYGKTKAEVKKKMTAYLDEQEKGWSFSYMLDEWLRYKEAQVKAHTYYTYMSPVNRLRKAFEGCYAKDITPSQIQAYINGMADKDYKRTTVQRPLSILKMAYDFAITTDGSGITYNPCSSIRIPKNVVTGKRSLAGSDDIEIIKHSLDVPFGLFAYLLIYTGLRKGEALALTDKDFHDGRIWVTKSVSWNTNSPTITTPKTAHSVRSVPILSPLRDALPEWKGYLFSADGGKSPLTAREFKLRWEKYMHTAGLSDYVVVTHKNEKNNNTYSKKVWADRLVPHQLRHEFATMCLDAGLDAIDTQELLGHSRIQTTQTIYQHIKDSRRTSSESKLEAFVATK